MKKYSIIAFVILAFIGVGIWIKPLMMSFTGFPKNFQLTNGDEVENKDKLPFYLMLIYYETLCALSENKISTVTVSDREYLEKLLMKEYYMYYQESKKIPSLKNKRIYDLFYRAGGNVMKRYKEQGNMFFEKTYPAEFIEYINNYDSNALEENVVKASDAYILHSKKAAIRYVEELPYFYSCNGFYDMNHTLYFFEYYLTILENPKNENKAYSEAIRKLLKNEMLKKDSFFKSDINFFKECRRDNPKGKKFDDLREELGIIDCISVPKSYVNMSRYSFRKKVESFIDWIMEYEEPLKKDKNRDL